MINSLKKLSFALLALFALSGWATKQPETSKDLISHELVGPVKSVTIRPDSTNLKTTKEGKTWVLQKLSFNELGQRIRDENHFHDLNSPQPENEIIVTTYAYDDKGKLLKASSTVNRILEDVVHYLYKDGESLPYMTIMKGDGYSYSQTYTYDEQGNEIVVEEKDREVGDVTTYKTEYNENNQAIIEKAYYEGELYVTTVISYNEQGNLVKEVSEWDSGRNPITTYEYLKADSHGNWLERKVIRSEAEGYVIERRTINYY